MASAAVSDEGALRMRPTPCGCTSALFSGIHRNCRASGNAATVSPTARPHKLHIPRPAAGGRSRPFRCSSSPNCKRFAGLQFGSICLARKSRQKDALENDLWRLRADSFQRPDGRRISTIPMAFGADKCTTRSYRQAESIPVLLISGIPDRRADVVIGPYKHI